MGCVRLAQVIQVRRFISRSNYTVIIQSVEKCLDELAA